MNYIKTYDPHFNTKDNQFKRQAEIKSAAWLYSKHLHRPQLEWEHSVDYFKKNYSMQPVSYSIVRKDAEKETKISEVFDMLKNLLSAGEKNE